MTTKRIWLFSAMLTTLVGCAADAPEATTDTAAGELRTTELRELACEGTSRTDSSTATVDYDGGDTVQVTVDRSVCTFVWGIPTGCVPQHNRVRLPIVEKTITASRVKLVLDNDGTDLDLTISPDTRKGTWFAHENDYTYDLKCDAVVLEPK